MEPCPGFRWAACGRGSASPPSGEGGRDVLRKVGPKARGAVGWAGRRRGQTGPDPCPTDKGFGPHPELPCKGRDVVSSCPGFL